MTFRFTNKSIYYKGRKLGNYAYITEKEKRDMTKMEFALAIAEKIEDAEVKVMEKANGVERTGIRIGHCDIAPIIYIDKMYDNDLCVDCATEEVMMIYSASQKELPFEYKRIQEWEWAKDKLELRLFNDSTNADIYEYCDDYGFNDLILVPYVRLSEEAVVKVTRVLADGWGVYDWEILDKAHENMKTKKHIIKSMFETLCELAPELNISYFGENEEKMFVVTNEHRCFGASSIIYLQEELENRFPNGYIVIPASVHEVLVLKYDGDSREAIAQMINDVNKEQVAPEERLGNHGYFFNCME